MTDEQVDKTRLSYAQTKKVGVVISPAFLGYLLLMVFGTLILIGLQRQFWYGEFGYYEYNKLKSELAKQQKINAEQQLVNDTLRADIHDLKTGSSAVEEHARLVLGLVKSGETFVELSDTPLVSERQVPLSVDNTHATEPVDGLLDESADVVFTDVGSSTGEKQ